MLNTLLWRVLLYSVLLLSLQQASANMSGFCPSSISQDKFNQVFQGRCYRFVFNSRLEYFDAEKYCRKHGGHLAMPKTKDINDFLSQRLHYTYGYPYEVWIGLNDNDVENVFEWADGNKLGSSYSNWADGDEGPRGGLLHPFAHLYEDCVALDVWSDGGWRDCRCESLDLIVDERKYFVCEFLSIPKTTSPPSRTPAESHTSPVLSTRMTTKTPTPTTSRATRDMINRMTSERTNAASTEFTSRGTSPTTTEMTSSITSPVETKITNRMTTDKSQMTTVMTGQKITNTSQMMANTTNQITTGTTRQMTTKITSKQSRCPSSIPQDRFNQVFQGHCFRFVFQTKLIYWEAQRYCKDRGGNLAMPKTRAINAFLAKHVHFIYGYWQGVWIGLHDRDGDRQYTWTDGSTLDSFTNWGQGHPGSEASSSGRAHHMYDNCVALDGSSGEGRWRDYKCWHMAFAGEELKYFVCQFPIVISF